MIRTLILPIPLLLLGFANCATAKQDAVGSQLSAERPTPALAEITARVKAAYGGKKLEELKSIRVQTDRGLGWPGQGQTADFVEFVSDVIDFQADLENLRASRERWVQQNGNIYLDRQVTAPGGGVTTINYGTGTYTTNEEATFHRSFGVELTGTDTLIAYSLVTDPHDLTLEEPVYYLGKWHDRVSLKIAPTNPVSTAYIERDTGLITRFEVKLRDDTWNAVFDHHETKQGITFARERMDYRNDVMVQFAPNREHSFNNVRWSILEIEDDLTAPAEQIDMSEMTVDPVSATVHHVGHGDYSAFIDAGSYIIATNPYGGLKDRFEAYQKARSSQKPLRYVISTHHHADHLSGVTEAAELGATIVATPMTIKTLQAGDTYKAVNMQTLNPSDTIGPVKTYTVPTSHVAEYAVIYVPDGKVIYQDDHYNPTLADGPSHVNQSGLVFQNRVDELGLDVEIVLSGHSRKAEKWTDFEAAAAKETLGDICPRNREICRDK